MIKAKITNRIQKIRQPPSVMVTLHPGFSFSIVAKVGLEPTRFLRALDFESSVSTNSTTWP
jgi:hypothetical protein